MHAHEYEVLTCDWAKYDDHMLYSASVDKTIRGRLASMLFTVTITGFDVRAGARPVPVCVMRGHTYGIRRIQCSPHDRAHVASVGYDFTTRRDWP